MQVKNRGHKIQFKEDVLPTSENFFVEKGYLTEGDLRQYKGKDMGSLDSFVAEGQVFLNRLTEKFWDDVVSNDETCIPEESFVEGAGTKRGRKKDSKNRNYTDTSLVRRNTRSVLRACPQSS